MFKENNGKLYSAFPHIYKNYEYISIPYSKVEWNERKERFGPICAFDTLENAKTFLKKMREPVIKFVIYQIEAVPSLDKDVWEWEGCEGNGTFYFYMKNIDLPNGTILVDRFKIIREVFGDESI